MTEEEVKALLREASEKIKEGFIPAMTNLLMDVFQHGINKGTEIGLKVGTNAPQSNNHCSIPWQTGEPNESGAYLITTYNGKVLTDYWRVYRWDYRNRFEVKSWCKLSDIKPYKEETR